MKKKRRNKRKKNLKIAIVFIVIVAALAAAYFAIAAYFGSHFFPNTSINGYDVSGMTAEDADQTLVNATSNYLLTIYDRDGNKYHLTGEDFDYQCTLTHSSAGLLDSQGGFTWPVNLKEEHTYTLDAKTSYDAEALSALIATLPLFDEEQMTAPADAYLTYENGDCKIQPEIMGNTPDTEHMTATITAAVAADVSEVTLTDEDYINPTVLSDDESLTDSINTMGRYLGASVTYDIKGYEEVLTADKIKEWLIVGEDGSVSLDRSQVTRYVQYLASTYNTYADKRDFQTSSGDTVIIGGGDYGWIINKEAEEAELIENIESGTPVTRKPCYTQEAFHEGKDDIGNTYIEIDYTNQHIWYYKKGELVCESDIVSGNLNRNNGSPDGVYKIVYKKSPATLVGENYESDVNFFMPFAYNVGIHDASWRSEGEFGGTTYKTSGSHGCINVPYEFAEQLYNIVEVGTPVIAFYREPVTLTAESARISNAYSYVSSNDR